MHLRGLLSWQPLAGALSLDLRFYLPRPKRLFWKKRPMYAQLAPVTPDVTNLAKCIEDALNGVAWRDDREIVHEQIWKMYTAGPGWGDPRPRVELRARVLTDLIHAAPNWDGLDIDTEGPTRAAPGDRVRQATCNAEDQ
jgi:hypothetical protein